MALPIVSPGKKTATVTKKTSLSHKYIALNNPEAINENLNRTFVLFADTVKAVNIISINND